ARLSKGFETSKVRLTFFRSTSGAEVIRSPPGSPGAARTASRRLGHRRAVSNSAALPDKGQTHGGSADGRRSRPAWRPDAASCPESGGGGQHRHRAWGSSP